MTMTRGSSRTIYGGLGQCVEQRFVTMITDTTNSVNMIAYLRKLRLNMIRGYKTKWVWLILDNHKSHHTEEVLQEMKR